MLNFFHWCNFNNSNIVVDFIIVQYLSPLHCLIIKRIETTCYKKIYKYNSGKTTWRLVDEIDVAHWTIVQNKINELKKNFSFQQYKEELQVFEK